MKGLCALAALAFAFAPVAAHPASRTTFLDPFTRLYQTDDDAEGRRLESEPGWWPVPNGLKDPLAKRPQARVTYCVYSKSRTPLAGYDASKASPLFKVNQAGYAPSRRKFAYMGAWLGPKLGAWRPSARLGAWRVVDASGGGTAFESREPPVQRLADATTKEGVPFTGEVTYEMDFSSVTNEGVYFVEVDGVGRSADFRIWRGAVEDAFRVHMGGLYQKRCGIAKAEPHTHWTAGACHMSVVRGTFPPDGGDLPKGVSWFDLIDENTDWEGGERIAVSGGWHDAADYDRRPAHLSVVNDLCAVYLLRPGNFADGQLALPERGNGIPDVLDEAEWGLRHLLSCQQADGGVGTWIEGTRHPSPGSLAERDTIRYAVSRATRASSLAYAAAASLLARCHGSFREKYLASAVRAWDFALREKPASCAFAHERSTGLFSKERTLVPWEEPSALPARELAKAAVNLHALTGERRFLDALAERKKEALDDLARNSWRWGALSFAGERALGVPHEAEELFGKWEAKVVGKAGEMLREVEGAYAYRCPWWFPGKGWFSAMSWGQCHPLRRAETLVAAHALTGDERFLDAAYAANDFHCGCNPAGMTLTSRLGSVYPVSFLDLPSYADGIAEFVPGITPYRWNYGLAPKAVEMVFGGDRALASKWPIWRRWGNLENQTVAASEYTVSETIGPAAAVCGYLLEPSGLPPPVRPAPADDIRNLPGYWPIP